MYCHVAVPAHPIRHVSTSVLPLPILKPLPHSLTLLNPRSALSLSLSLVEAPMGGEVAEAESAPLIFDGEEEIGVPEIGEEVLEGVMRWLEEEIARPSSPSYYQEAAFVTINGNEESCGPSFSASASTVMASIDTRGGGQSAAAYFFGVPEDGVTGKGSWPFVSAVDAWFWPVTEFDQAAGKGDGEDEDAWLADVLGGPLLEVDEMPF